MINNYKKYKAAPRIKMPAPMSRVNVTTRYGTNNIARYIGNGSFIAGKYIKLSWKEIVNITPVDTNKGQ